MKSERKRDNNRAYDAQRRQDKPWRAWYKTQQWQALRLGQFAKQPLCERCQSRGITRAANVAHHIVDHKGDAVLFYDAANLASLCSDCHDIDEQRIAHGGKPRQTIGADGWPI